MHRFVLIIFSFCLGNASYSQIDTTTYKTLNDSVFVVGDIIIVRDIVFNQPGGSRINFESYVYLDLIAHFLLKYPNLKIEIAMHSDTRGSKSFAVTYTDKQAEAVKKCLIEKYGIDSSRLSSKGFGSSEYIIPDDLIKAETDKLEIQRLHQINRRMELRVVGFLDDCSDFQSYKKS